MKILAIDIGSSSIKAAILTGPGVPKRVVKAAFSTRYDSTRAEVDEKNILAALHQVIVQLGASVKKVEAIVPTVMAPSWVAMDKRGNAITPIVTHQDRRAIEEARQIESSVGLKRHIKIAGNRPFPGGISSTTWRWFNQHEWAVMKRADLVGHLSTWLCRQFTGARVIDPSNAAFMGLYNTTTLGGWSDELIEAVSADRALLPEIREANRIAGHVTEKGAAAFGLLEGTPVLTGCMDGSAAMLAAGDKIGQMLNVSGSTDVLALLVDHPKPHESLLTRPLGIGKKWLTVSTLAAAGSAVEWARNTFFRDLSANDFYKLLNRIQRQKTAVHFVPDLAGSRTAIDESTGSISGLRLGTTREEMLAALCHGLATASGERIGLLKDQYRKILPTIVMSGGGQSGLSTVLRRDWSKYGTWKFRTVEHATLRGLWQLT